MISSGGPAAAESSEHGGGRRVAPPTAIKSPHVPRRLIVIARMSCQKTSTVALRSGLYNQRLGEGTPTEYQGRQSSAFIPMVSIVRGSRIEIISGARQWCVMSPDSFATGIDYLLERAVGTCMNGVSFGDHSYTDLDFADDVCLLAELL